MMNLREYNDDVSELCKENSSKMKRTKESQILTFL